MPSGYGTQGNLLGKMLMQNGHAVAFQPFHGLSGVPINWEGFTIFPGSGEDPWALDLLPAVYRNWQADLVITLMDAWVLEPPKLQGMNVAHWLPVDCSPMGQLDRKVLDAGGGQPIAMSKFGQQMMTEAGYDARYAPHALDMDTWKPLGDDERKQLREQIGFTDRFLIGINAANQDPQRKGFGEQFEAFAEFSRRHDDALMLVHSRAETRQGVNLVEAIAYLGMQQKIILGDQYAIAGGLVTEPQMVTWHGYLDVLSNCSWGEGFGIPVLQSQATGTPVIVTDCSAMTELCGAGFLVRGQKFRNRGHSSNWTIPYIGSYGDPDYFKGSILDAYEQAYQGAAGMRDQARAFALAHYDAENVFRECWEPILAELCPQPQVPQHQDVKIESLTLKPPAALPGAVPA